MSGGLLQLEYNTEYNFLSVKPEITYFKCVYKRHTNFVMNLVEQNVFNFGFGKTSTIKLDMIGDLITSVVLQITIPNVSVNKGIKFAWVKKLGLALINCVKLYIGGQLIDSQLGEWMYIWLVLSINNVRNKEKGYAVLFGNVEELIAYNNSDKPEYVLQIPLLFWFNRLIYLALPIVAIRYQDVMVKVKIQELKKLIITNDPEFIKCNSLELVDFRILINYVYLDMPERRLFAQQNHEYLIDQVQTDIDYLYDKKSLIKLDFTLNCRDLIWVSRNPDYCSCERFLCYTHEDKWNNAIRDFSYVLLEDSIILSPNKLFDCNNKLWQIFPPETSSITENNKIIINNDSLYYFYINTDSLIIDNTSITDKIRATININEHNQITILNLITKINIVDVSIPVRYYKDTRICNHDVYINEPLNFGKYLDESCNPTCAASLYCDGYELITKHSGKFFNELQPYYYYNVSIPKGINVYPFALDPQNFNPSGEIDFTELTSKYLKLWNDIDNCYSCYKAEYELMVFTRNYNTLLIDHGMIGLIVSLSAVDAY